VAGLPLTLAAPPDLRRRFELAASGEPLCGLSPSVRAELAGVLERTRGFDELPGKWQAALLRAEAAGRGAPLPERGSCCSGATA